MGLRITVERNVLLKRLAALVAEFPLLAADHIVRFDVCGYPGFHGGVHAVEMSTELPVESVEVHWCPCEDVEVSVESDCDSVYHAG